MSATLETRIIEKSEKGEAQVQVAVCEMGDA